MNSSNLLRWCGLAAILGGALLLISDLLGLIPTTGSFSEASTTVSYAVESGLRLLGVMLVLLGLVGLYARQSGASGAPGLIGFLAAFAGTSLLLGAFWANAFVVPTLATEAPGLLDAPTTGTLRLGFTSAFALGALGWVLFGAATFRARIYPRAASVLLMVGAVLTFTPLPVSGLVFDVAVAWLGFALLSDNQPPTSRAERVK